MARRPDLPSRRSSASEAAPAPRRTRQPAGEARTVDVRDWLGGVRLSAFMFIMLGLVILAVLVLVPTIGTYIEQRQRIDALEHSVQVTQQRVDELEAERDRWSDEAYITTQARDRLYYHLPGETVYLIDNDLDPATLPQEQKQVSVDVQVARSDWMGAMLRSITESGLTRNVVVPAAPTPAEPTPAVTEPTESEPTRTTPAEGAGQGDEAAPSDAADG